MKILTFAAMAVFSGAMAQAWAQTPPDHVRTLFPRENAPGLSVISEKTLSADQRSFMYSKTTRNTEGYLKVQVSPGYLEQLSELAGSPVLHKGRRDGETALGGHTLLGTVDEGEFRQAYLLGAKGKADRMVTLWRYKEAGASMVVVEENINQQIGTMRAVLALAFHPTASKCLWKVDAFDADIMAEVVIEDSLSADRPRKPVAQVLQEARTLVQFAQAQSTVR